MPCRKVWPISNCLLYGCETWTLYRRHLKQLERFHMLSLRTILNIKGQDRVSNLQVLDMAKSTSIEAMILKSRLHWVGHIIHKEDRLPKQMMFGELASGKRKQGRPLKRFKDCIKASISHAEITPKELDPAFMTGLDDDPSPDTPWTRPRRGATHRWRRPGKEERRRLKLPAIPVSSPCPHCPRTCKSRIGLHSHLRAHGRREQR